MALIRWEPAREIESLQQEVNRLFGSMFEAQGRRTGGGSRGWLPAMDLVEKDDQYLLKADLPGVPPEDVKIELEDDVLTISGRRESSHESHNEGVHRVERASGEFSRSLTLPAGVDPEKVQASFEHGVLEVRIPKPEGHKPRRVEISVGGKAPTIEGGAADGAGSEHRSEQPAPAQS